jgi:surface polysaccharide O-acyltransferase-like enzyme
MERNNSVDTVRLIAITAVIVIHTRPFAYMENGNELYDYLFLILNQSARFAIPFFFVISGYYWGTKIRRGDSLLEVSARMLIKLALVFCVWSLFYLIPHDVAVLARSSVTDIVQGSYARLLRLSQDPVTLVMQGTKDHLWFLPALAYALVITSTMLFARLPVLLLVVAITLYLFGLAAKAYAWTPVGIDLFGFNTRNGPFFSTIFFVSGYFLSARTPAPAWFKAGLLLFALGLLLHFAEISFLWQAFHISPVNHDYVLGTYLMGLGAAVVALSNHGSLNSSTAGSIGKLTLGIYAIHVLFIEMAAPYTPHSSPVMEFVYPIAVLALSAGSVYLLSKLRFVRAIVV